MNAEIESRLAAILRQYDARTDTNAVQFALSCPRINWEWQWPERMSKYFIASTTKLYVATLVMQLRAEGKIDIGKPAIQYLPDHIMEGIHVFKGTKSDHLITVRQLLSQTSGIADYFEEKGATGKSQFAKALEEDFSWQLEDVLRITKKRTQAQILS